SSGQETRTMSAPASSSWRTCSMVAAASAVSVLVIDWTVIGASPPTSTLPTRILRLWRRSMARQGRTEGWASVVMAGENRRFAPEAEAGASVRRLVGARGGLGRGWLHRRRRELGGGPDRSRGGRFLRCGGRGLLGELGERGLRRRQDAARAAAHEHLEVGRL